VPRKYVAVALVAAAGLLPLVAVGAGWDWYLDGPLLLLLGLLAGYVVGAWLPTAAAAACVAVVTAALVVAHQLHDDDYHWLDDTVFFLVVVGGPAVAGAAVTLRARQVRRLEQVRAEYDEQQRVDVAAARLEEQNRVQEQVHSRLAERIAGIAVRAEGAQRHPAGHDATDDLGVIETEARAVLDQLRAALGSLASQPVDEPLDKPVEEQVEEPVEPALEEAHAPRISLPDWATPVVLGVALAVETAVVDAARGPMWVNAVAVLAVTAPLVVRRRRPVVAATLVSLAGVAMSTWLTPIPETVTGVALMVVVFYSVGAWCRGRTWLGGWAVATAGMVAMALVSGVAGGEEDSVAIVLLWTTGAVLVGRVTAGWQERLRHTERIVAALEEGRGAELRLAVARERQAIASQLHDTVAHAMTVVCLQAAATQRAGGDVDGTLDTIVGTATASLAELRDGLDEIETSAHPLDRSRIAALGRRTGVDVVVTSSAPVPPGPGAALAFRVVREAVVNAARHAPGSAVEVRIHSTGDLLSVEVLDDGGAGDPLEVGTGSGLTGLSEAVIPMGGSMSWGLRDQGGFRVVAWIPTTPVEGTAAERTLEAAG
jgi:signal transduction histidine kinase